jgi:sulfonate transport system substrate-binding protein
LESTRNHYLINLLNLKGLTVKKKTFISTIVGALLALGVSAVPAQAVERTLNLDYANWNPLSLVIKDQGWLETDLKKLNTRVNWVYSAGSAAAIQNLNANAIQLGSSAGVAAYVARANGVGIRSIAVFSQPNWAALVVKKGSSISAGQLKGKKIAAQKGTDPYFFLLQVLNKRGLDPFKDVTIVNLAHADGKAALIRGDVDVWSGLDPITSQTVKIDGSKIIYENKALNTWGIISAREDFLKSNRDITIAVLKNYQKARAWILANPDKAAQILANSAKIDLDVAKNVLVNRTKVNVPLVPGSLQSGVLKAIKPTLVSDAQVKSQADADSALTSLYDTSFALRALKK